MKEQALMNSLCYTAWDLRKNDGQNEPENAQTAAAAWAGARGGGGRERRRDANIKAAREKISRNKKIRLPFPWVCVARNKSRSRGTEYEDDARQESSESSSRCHDDKRPPAHEAIIRPLLKCKHRKVSNKLLEYTITTTAPRSHPCTCIV